MGGKRKEGRGRRVAVEPPMLPRVFEGKEVLDRLLGELGAQVDARGAVRRFAAAIAEGKEPPEVFPGLFTEEPRFRAPEDALRLYGNLFGLWDRLEEGEDPEELLAAQPPPRGEAGNGETEDVDEIVLEPQVELPPKGSVPGTEVPVEVVEGTWQKLASLPSRERTRQQDRYINLQPELAEWARTVEGLSGVAQETLEYLCFELSEMFDNAFGPRMQAVRYRDLVDASPDEAPELQPYAYDYLLDTLDEAEIDDEEALLPDERQHIEHYAQQALVALTGAVRDEGWLH